MNTVKNRIVPEKNITQFHIEEENNHLPNKGWISSMCRYVVFNLEKYENMYTNEYKIFLSIFSPFLGHNLMYNY